MKNKVEEGEDWVEGKAGRGRGRVLGGGSRSRRRGYTKDESVEGWRRRQQEDSLIITVNSRDDGEGGGVEGRGKGDCCGEGVRKRECWEKGGSNAMWEQRCTCPSPFCQKGLPLCRNDIVKKNCSYNSYIYT